MKRTAILLAAMFACSPAMADEEQLVVSLQRLTMDTALKIAQGAIAACREKGISVGATVVDRDGTTQVQLRDTVAVPITLGISQGKAAAAANFGVNTSELADRANTPIGRTPGMVMSTGGLLIQVGGSFLGAVGVSGAPTGETDEECAQAGIDVVKDDLELM